MKTSLQLNNLLLCGFI